jgi:diamine N-acetyltransferase
MMIYGERIRLRGMERSDLPRFVTWLNDPEVNIGLAIYPVLSQVEEENWFENIQKKPQAEHPLVIEIRMPRSPVQGEPLSTPNSRPPEVDWIPIGDCSFFNLDRTNRSCELGIVIGEKRFWNQGFGTETMGLLLKFGFETLNLHRIYLRVFASNPRAIRAYEKAGFVLEGRLREAVFINGKYVDILIMSVLEGR